MYRLIMLTCFLLFMLLLILLSTLLLLFSITILIYLFLVFTSPLIETKYCDQCVSMYVCMYVCLSVCLFVCVCLSVSSHVLKSTSIFHTTKFSESVTRDCGLVFLWWKCNAFILFIYNEIVHVYTRIRKNKKKQTNKHTAGNQTTTHTKIQ